MILDFGFLLLFSACVAALVNLTWYASCLECFDVCTGNTSPHLRSCVVWCGHIFSFFYRIASFHGWGASRFFCGVFWRSFGETCRYYFDSQIFLFLWQIQRCLSCAVEIKQHPGWNWIIVWDRSENETLWFSFCSAYFGPCFALCLQLKARTFGWFRRHASDVEQTGEMQERGRVNRWSLVHGGQSTGASMASLQLQTAVVVADSMARRRRVKAHGHPTNRRACRREKW